MSETKYKRIEVTDNWSLDEKAAKKEQIVKIDSGIPGCIWYRLVLDADVPEDAQAEISYAITDEDVQDTSELQDKWSEPLVNPRDVMIIGPRGRYLQLRIVVSTNDKNDSVPPIKGIRLYYSPATYLKHLPAVYQEDPLSRDFLEEYLSIFETVLANLESRIEDVPRLFDVKETPNEFLSWLSTWVGTVKDENWSEGKWREFLSRAAELYKYRGTKEEINEIIKIYTGTHPLAIVERVLLKCTSPYLTKVLNLLFGGPYSFCVLLEPEQVKTEKDRKVVLRIIESEKPAHTCGGFAIIEQRIRLNWHTYLGKNTCLSEPKAEMILGKAILSLTSVLPSPPLSDKTFK